MGAEEAWAESLALAERSTPEQDLTLVPFVAYTLAEEDRYWGALREAPEFAGVFEERRRRLGPIHGLLHYFPGW